MPDPYPSLQAAVFAWLTADATLTPVFSGGFVAGRSGMAQLFPFGRVACRKESDSLSVEDEHHTLTLSSYALDADEVMTAGGLLLARYLDETRAALEFTDSRGRAWRESRRTEGDVEGPDWIGTAASVAGGTDGYIYRHRVPIDVWVVRV